MIYCRMRIGCVAQVMARMLQFMSDSCMSDHLHDWQMGMMDCFDVCVRTDVSSTNELVAISLQLSFNPQI